MLMEDGPDMHSAFVVHENNKKTLCAEVLQAMHGMLIGALLFHMKFREDPEEIIFIFNTHDACVANQMVNGKQHTACFHW